MWLTLVSLVGLFVAGYLALYKLGYIGVLTCTVGSCETVQTSKWAMFLGLPVAVWGVGYYVSTLALSFASTLPRYEDSRGMSLALLILTGWGFVFSAWLTALELWVIHAICQWCVVSAILATIMFVIALLDWRATRGMSPAADDEAVPSPS
jgi:uncharacterized membrane protein